MHYDAHAELLSRLAAVPNRVAQAAASAGPVDAAPGEWAPVIVVGHLTRVDETVWLPRFQEMAVVENPHWQWWEQPDYDWAGTYGGRDLSEVVAEFTANRTAIVEHLTNLDPPGWARVGTHDTFGRVDVEGLAREILVHDGEHLRQLTTR